MSEGIYLLPTATLAEYFAPELEAWRASAGDLGGSNLPATVAAVDYASPAHARSSISSCAAAVDRQHNLPVPVTAPVLRGARGEAGTGSTPCDEHVAYERIYGRAHPRSTR